MADFVKVICPIDGLTIIQTTITPGKKTGMSSRSLREHGSWDFNNVITCPNNHKFLVEGNIDIRWDPADPVTT